MAGKRTTGPVVPSDVTQGAYDQIQDYEKTLPEDVRSDFLQGVVESSNKEIAEDEKTGVPKEQLDLLRQMVTKLDALRAEEEKNAKPLVDFLTKHDGKMPASIALQYEHQSPKGKEQHAPAPDVTPQVENDPAPVVAEDKGDATDGGSPEVAPPATTPAVVQASTEAKQTREKEKVTEKQKQVTDKEAENLKLRKALIDIEEKQRSIYAKDVAKEEVQSKVLYQRSNKALEELLKHTKESQEVIVTFSGEQQKVLEDIRDLLKQARSASLEDLPKIQSQLEYLRGKGTQLGKGSPDFNKEFQSQSKIAGQITSPPYSISSRLGEAAKDSAKNFGQFVYSAVPEPFKILGEGAASVGSSLFHAVTGNRGRDAQDTADFGRGRIDALSGLAGQIHGAIRDNAKSDKQSTKSSGNTFGRFTPKENAPRIMGGVKESLVGSLATKVMGNAEHVLGGSQQEGQASTIKVPELDIGKLSIDLISFKDIDDNDGKLMKLLKKAFHGGGEEGGVEGILKSILGLLGKSLLVAGAGALGYEIGTALNKYVLDPLAEKLTGVKGAGVGTYVYDSINKMQNAHVITTGASDEQLAKYASQKKGGEIAQQYLKAGNGHVSEKQAAYLKKEGVDIPEDLVVGGEEGKRLDALASAAHDKPGAAPQVTATPKPTPSTLSPEAMIMGPPAPDKAGATATAGGAQAVAVQAAMAKDSQAKAIVAAQASTTGDSAAKAASVGGNSRNVAMASNKPHVIVAPVPSPSKTPADKGGGDDGSLPIVTGTARNQENAFAAYQQQVFSPY